MLNLFLSNLSVYIEFWLFSDAVSIRGHVASNKIAAQLHTMN
jgi:hypothetical protein